MCYACTMARQTPDIPAERELDNPLESWLGYQLRRASSVMFADLAKTLDDLAIRPTEASVLLLIARNPDITQTRIGRILAIKRANMAPIAALLNERDLIDRSRVDGRSQGLHVTRTGADLAHEIERRIGLHEARFLIDLPVEGRRALTALLQRVWQG